MLKKVALCELIFATLQKIAPAQLNCQKFTFKKTEDFLQNFRTVHS
jgi:hypothetical protein